VSSPVSGHEPFASSEDLLGSISPEPRAPSTAAVPAAQLTTTPQGCISTAPCRSAATVGDAIGAARCAVGIQFLFHPERKQLSIRAISPGVKCCFKARPVTQ